MCGFLLDKTRQLPLDYLLIMFFVVTLLLKFISKLCFSSYVPQLNSPTHLKVNRDDINTFADNVFFF